VEKSFNPYTKKSAKMPSDYTGSRSAKGMVDGVLSGCCVLQRVAVCCSVLQRVAVWAKGMVDSVLSGCRVLQCVAVCCNVLQWVAMRAKSLVHDVPAGAALCIAEKQHMCIQIALSIHQ